MIDFNQYSVEELAQLNRDLVEHLRLRRQRESQQNMTRFNLYDKVSFRTQDGAFVEGKIIRFNQKTVTVETSNNSWRVSPEFLTKIIETTTVVEKTAVKKSVIVPSRNAPCSCGSGKKSKRCCFN